MLSVVERERSYGGKSAHQRAHERRARLVEATVRVLAVLGEARTTMTAICQEAGLTERYFYESFANRDAALQTALDHVCDAIATEAVRVLEQTPGPPDARVHAVMSSFVDQVERDPALGMVAVVHSSATPALRRRRHELVGTFADLVAGEAEALYGEQAWPAERARLHGMVWIAGFAELLAGWLTGDLALDRDELVDVAGDLFAAVSRRP
jgi:AcrR family transcriptional regulator